MTLKKVGGVTLPVPTTGVSYGQHLGEVVKPIVGFASKTVGKSGEAPVGQGVQVSETLSKGVVTDGHTIRVSGGRTLNLGNYESARIDVGIEVPTTKVLLDDAYEFASDWVSEKIEEAVASAVKP